MTVLIDSIVFDLSALQGGMAESDIIGSTENGGADHLSSGRSDLIVQFLDGEQVSAAGRAPDHRVGLVLVGHQHLAGTAVGAFELDFQLANVLLAHDVNSLRLVRDAMGGVYRAVNA